MAASRMHRWDGRSSAASSLQPSPPYFSYRPYSRSFMGALRRTRFIPWRLPMAEPSAGDPDTILRRKIRRYSLILLIVALCLAVWGEVSRVRARASLGKESAEAAIPTVITVTPNPTSLAQDLVLPRPLQPSIEHPTSAPTTAHISNSPTPTPTART